MSFSSGMNWPTFWLDVKTWMVGCKDWLSAQTKCLPMFCAQQNNTKMKTESEIERFWIGICCMLNLNSQRQFWKNAFQLKMSDKTLNQVFRNKICLRRNCAWKRISKERKEEIILVVTWLILRHKSWRFTCTANEQRTTLNQLTLLDKDWNNFCLFLRLHFCVFVCLFETGLHDYRKYFMGKCC